MSNANRPKYRVVCYEDENFAVQELIDESHYDDWSGWKDYKITGKGQQGLDAATELRNNLINNTENATN